MARALGAQPPILGLQHVEEPKDLRGILARRLAGRLRLQPLVDSLEVDAHHAVFTAREVVVELLVVVELGLHVGRMRRLSRTGWALVRRRLLLLLLLGLVAAVQVIEITLVAIRMLILGRPGHARL